MIRQFLLWVFRPRRYVYAVAMFATDQRSYRGYADDAAMGSATPKAAQNVSWTQVVDENFRIRIEMQETGGASGNFVPRLQYNLNSAGFVNVTDTSTVVRASASPHIADGAATADLLTNGTGTFAAGAFDEVDGLTGTHTVAASGHTEAEWCVQILSADVVDADSIVLRAIGKNNSTTAFDTYTVLGPTITVSEAGDPNATATPSTIAVVGTLPAPTLLATATTAVAVVACIATVPAPTIEATGGAAVETGWDEWGRFYTANNSETGRYPAAEDQVSESGFLLFSLAVITTVTPSTVAAVATVPAVTVSGTVEIDTEDIIATADIPQPAIQIIPAPQKVRPDADQSIGTWTTDTGGTTNLWDAINETAASDADYVKSAVNPTNNELIVTLTNLEDPLSSTGHEVRFRYRKA